MKPQNWLSPFVASITVGGGLACLCSCPRPASKPASDFNGVGTRKKGKITTNAGGLGARRRPASPCAPHYSLDTNFGPAPAGFAPLTSLNPRGELPISGRASERPSKLYGFVQVPSRTTRKLPESAPLVSAASEVGSADFQFQHHSQTPHTAGAAGGGIG